MSAYYKVPFARDQVKSVIAALMGGSLPATLSTTFASTIKLIPVVGQVLGSASMTIIGGASTYAVAQVFIRHFEAGGTFLTFDAEKARSYYQEMYNKGRTVVTKMRKKKVSESDSDTSATQEVNTEELKG
jgi:uncharacterized protein (DUF697 family)